MNSRNQIKLTEYERKYIRIVGQGFGVHGRSDVMGQIYALLNLKSKTRETALSQQDIATLIHKSISTVSRTLKKLVQGGYCDYILEDNELERAERRYHAKRDYKELLLARITQSITEAHALVESLTKLSQSIPKERADENQSLLEQIQHHIEETQVASKAVEQLGKDIMDGIGKTSK